MPLPEPTVCLRCGRILHGDAELGEIADAAVGSLDRMRLVLPPGVRVALRMVADEMVCRAGRCGGSRA